MTRTASSRRSWMSGSRASAMTSTCRSISTASKASAAHCSPAKACISNSCRLLAELQRDRFGDLAEEVVAFVVDDDERREVAHLDLPDRFHPELGILEDLHLRDAVLREPRGRTADIG